MNTRYLSFLFFLLIMLNACTTETSSDKAQIAPEAPTTAEPTTSSTATNTGAINPSTVDDSAAEQIKTFLSSSFLTGHLSVMSAEDRQFQLYKIDLNEDGKNEYFVRFNSPYFCGNDGCTFLLLSNEFTIISRFNVLSPPIFVSKTKNNGWRKLMVKSGDSYREMVYSDGKYPADPAALPASSSAPSGNEEVLFEDAAALSKTYLVPHNPFQQPKGVVERVQVYQKTFNAGTFSFLVNAMNREVTPVHISSKGLPRAFDETYEVEGGVKEGHLLDLNNDGFKELYLVIKPTGDSGNLNLMGVASYRDKSAGAIIVKDTKEIRKVNSDKIYVQDGQLFREFVQGNKQVKFTYKLSKGETGFVLEAIRL